MKAAVVGYVEESGTRGVVRAAGVVEEPHVEDHLRRELVGGVPAIAVVGF